jgi:hypothetical protein
VKPAMRFSDSQLAAMRKIRDRVTRSVQLEHDRPDDHDVRGAYRLRVQLEALS